MIEINERLHKAFGICLHEFGPKMKTWKGLCLNGCGLDFKDFNGHQDLLAQVSIPCDRCGGERHKKCKQGIPIIRRHPTKPCASDDICTDICVITCPSCDGLKTRRITRLQQIMEEWGEWSSFLAFIVICHQGVATFTGILTDANKLGAAVLEWKGSP